MKRLFHYNNTKRSTRKRLLLGVLSFLAFASSSIAQRLPYADSLLLDAQYDRIIEWAGTEERKAPGDSLWIVQVATRKAEALVRLGNFEEAENVLNGLGKQPAHPAAAAAIDIAYGSLYLNEGLYEKANARLEAAINRLESSGHQESFEASQALSYLGNLRRATGEYTQAEELLTRSLAVRERMFGKDSEWIAASYNDLGIVYGQSDPDKALDYYDRALRIYEKLHPHAHPKIAIALTNIGFAYSALELYGDATNNFEAALKIWGGIYPGAHPTKAFLNLSLGEIYRKLKNLPAATGYFEKALDLYTHSYGNKHPDVAVAYNALGNARLEQGNHYAALDAYQHALVSNLAGFDDVDIVSMPRITGYYNGRVLLNTMLFKAQALEARYFARTIRMSDLESARLALMSGDTLIGQLRRQIANEADKISLGAIAAQVYQSGVRICTEAAEVALRKQQWLGQAFYFAERGKSAVLLEGISDTHAKTFAHIPAQLLDRERQLRAALSLANTQLAQKPSAADEYRIRDQIFTIGRQYDQFIAQLERNFPQYYNLKYNTAAPSVDEIQRRLDDKTAIISYLIDEDHKGLYSFVITRKKYKVYQRPLPLDLDRNITGLRNGLVFNAQEPYHRAASNLSEVLLPKMPGGIEELVIIPTGRLSVVPFETLFMQKAKEGEPLPYLIRRYSIRYEFAASLILQKVETGNVPKAVLLCAPVNFGEHSLNDLPATAAEVQAMDALFSDAHFERTLLTEKKASETSIRNQPLNRYQYLHFATHGVVDEEHPELSRIYLTAGNGDDGEMYSGDLYNLELNADLVTLSACQTGLGKISKGEGVIGLSRALAYAGARRMLVSFWRVADASTSRLMQDFYRSLLATDGRDPGRHLREAKIKMITSGDYSAPYFWAPFVLIGF